jgi:hypothetical protein
MNEMPFPADELRALADVACDGALTDCQVARLEGLLRGNAEAQDFYLAHLAFDRRLRWVLTHRTEESVEPRPPAAVVPLVSAALPSTFGYLSSGWPVAYLVATVVLGIGLAIAAITHVSQPVQIVQRHLPSTFGRGAGGEGGRTADAVQSSVIGQITGMVDCNFAADAKTKDLRPKTAVSTGDKFTLLSGLLEITYSTGARVILQGPVTYTVESPTGGHLSLGKLTARLEKAEGAASPKSPFPLPPSAFVVRTPTATVTDLGTEFGVEVARSGETTSHVFHGSVQVQATSADVKCGQPVMLTANQSLRVAKQDAGQPMKLSRGVADAAAFVLPEQFQQFVESRRSTAFSRWRAYSQKLCHDSSLLAYYDFQSDSSVPSLLRNVAANGDTSLDGVLNNAAWSSGRMAGKQALQFNGPADYVEIHLPQRVDDLTLAAWICVYSLNNEHNVLLATEDAYQLGQVGWSVRFDACVDFDITRVTQGPVSYYPISKPLFDDRRLFRWTHVAVTYDHADGSVKFYANGALTDTTTMKPHVPVCIGRAWIGNWNPRNYRGPGYAPQDFHGRIDELAIFSRPLAGEEIRHMFEEGNVSTSGEAKGATGGQNR